jgi:glycoprotein endo-alpha-1,2-mannosidase
VNKYKEVLAFYYCWFGTPWGPAKTWVHWTSATHPGKAQFPVVSDPDVIEDNHRQLATTRYPLLGPYDSLDPGIIAGHIELARHYGITGWLLNWWHPVRYEFASIPELLEIPHKTTLLALDLAAKRDFKIAISYDSWMDVADNLRDGLVWYADHPAYWKIDGRPVVLIYAIPGHYMGQGPEPELRFTQDQLRAVRDTCRKAGHDPYIIGDICNPCDPRLDLMREYAKLLDGLYSYNVPKRICFRSSKVNFEQWLERYETMAKETKTLLFPTVGTGYDNHRISQTPCIIPADGDMPGYYDRMWQEVSRHHFDYIFLYTWNEWHEGTDIEPSLEMGTRYLEITKKWTVHA